MILNNLVPKNNSIARLAGSSFSTYRNLIKKLYIALEDAIPEEAQQIGGEGIVVEIDESKFGKRKNNRGHRVEGVWVLGSIEITNTRKIFLTTVNTRNALVMRECITRFVRPGSIIRTDGWAAYNDIPNCGDYSHKYRNFYPLSL
ncbi:unnamed protein product [Cunninghamella blakesleeana]